MSEITKRLWQCDQCGRTSQQNDLFSLPSGWREVGDGYGSTAHACERRECQAALQRFLDNELEVTCG